jgi:hypothetical protein
MRMGRLPHDPIAVAAAPQHLFGAVRPPARLDRSGIDFTPELYGNDIYPDCSAVSLANCARAVAALNGYQLVVDTTKVPIFYADSIGIDPSPALIEASEGAVLLDVLKYQQAKSFNVGPQKLVGRFGTVDSTSRTALAVTMDRLGAAYLGITLHDNDMQTVGQTWSLAPPAGPVDGGHCIFCWDFSGLGDTDTVRVGTWGAWQRCTWEWLEDRLDEAYGITWRQLARADGTFYSGLNADGLMAELDNITDANV